MTESIKLDPKNINSAELIKILENLEPSHTSIWEGRIISDQVSLKNYSYENLLSVFQSIQENETEDPEQLEQIRVKLLELNASDDSTFSLNNVKNTFHSIINLAKGESIDPNAILQDPNDEEIELNENSEEIELDENIESKPTSNTSAIPKWMFVAGVVTGIALSALLYSAHVYMNETPIACQTPSGLDKEHAAAYCDIAASTTNQKILTSVETILRDSQKSQEKIVQLQRDARICLDKQVGYNIPAIHAKVVDWLKDPLHRLSALDVIVEMAKHQASDSFTINTVKQGILEFAQSEDSTLQLKALTALFSLYARKDFVRDNNLIFDNVVQDPEKIHQENLGVLKNLIHNSNVNNNDFKRFFILFNHVSNFTDTHADFSNFSFARMGVESSLQTIESLLANEKYNRTYEILNKTYSSMLNEKQQNMAKIELQKVMNWSPLETPDLKQLLPIVKSSNTSLTVPPESLKFVVDNGSMENCGLLTELLAAVGNIKQIKDFAKLLLDKKTAGRVWGHIETDLDKQKQLYGKNIFLSLES